MRLWAARKQQQQQVNTASSWLQGEAIAASSPLPACLHPERCRIRHRPSTTTTAADSAGGGGVGGGRARWSCWSGDAPMKKEGDEDEWRHAREDLGRAPWDWAACSSSSSELLSLGRGRRRWSSGSWCCGRRKGAALGLQWLLLLAAALETNPRARAGGRRLHGWRPRRIWVGGVSSGSRRSSGERWLAGG